MTDEQQQRKDAMRVHLLTASKGKYQETEKKRRGKASGNNPAVTAQRFHGVFPNTQPGIIETDAYYFMDEPFVNVGADGVGIRYHCTACDKDHAFPITGEEHWGEYYVRTDEDTLPCHTFGDTAEYHMLRLLAGIKKRLDRE